MHWEMIFTIFFITLGPVKLIVPFATLTHDAPSGLRREIALRAFAISLVTVVGMFFFGRHFLGKFHVGIDTIRLTAGLILVVWSILMLRHPLDSPKVPESYPAPSRNMAMIPLTLPHTLTPQGIAAVVLLSYLVEGKGPFAAFEVLAMLAAMMVLNLLCMLSARKLLAWIGGPALLQVLGGVLAVLQAVLGMQVMINGMKGLGVIA